MKVEIWSDVTCPSCYTGKRKFEAGLAKFKYKNSIEVIWKSFELAPTLETNPTVRLPGFLAELKSVSLAEAQGMIGQVTSSARAAGLEFNLNESIPANSFNAHRLSQLAKKHGLQNKAEEILFKAYFVDGKNIDDLSTLQKVANDIGLDEAEVNAVLSSTEYADAVRRDIYEAAERGINSVPYFLFDGKLAVTGAQQSAVFLEALQQSFTAWQSENAMAGLIAMDGQSCKVDGNCP